MPDIATAKSTTSGHDKCPPTSASNPGHSLTVNGVSVLCVGDTFQPHGCDAHKPHPPTITAGSSSLTVDGKPVAFVGCACDCGDTIASGDNQVNVKS